MPAYGSNPWLDVAGGTAGANQSMANIALMQRQAQFRMQQFAAQQALEQQKLEIEKQAESRMGRQTDSTIGYQGAETGLTKAKTTGEELSNSLARDTMATQGRIGRLRGYEGSPDLMAMVQDPFSGPQMMGDLRAANVVPQGQFDLNPQQLVQALHAALGGQVYQQAAGTPQSAERLSQPMQGAPGTSFLDPFSHQVLASVPPRAISDYEKGRLEQEQARTAKMETPDQRWTRSMASIVANAMHPQPYDRPEMDMSGLTRQMDAFGSQYLGKTNTPSSSQTKRPTRAQAAEYVKKFGQAGAHNALQKDGYDTTGYAD